MQEFLDYLEKYDLLIELIITLLTIVLSLVAVFQTKSIAKRQLKQEESIAKQQADLQERQIKFQRTNKLSISALKTMKYSSFTSLLSPVRF